MKSIQVKQVFISSVSDGWDLLDFLINKNVTIYILSTSEKSDYEVRIHISPDTLRRQCLHKSMRRKRRVQHLFSLSCFNAL